MPLPQTLEFYPKLIYFIISYSFIIKEIKSVHPQCLLIYFLIVSFLSKICIVRILKYHANSLLALKHVCICWELNYINIWFPLTSDIKHFYCYFWSCTVPFSPTYLEKILHITRFMAFIISLVLCFALKNIFCFCYIDHFKRGQKCSGNFEVTGNP